MTSTPPRVTWCYGEPMARLTVTLDDDVHQALKEAAARERSGLTSEEAMDLAVRETAAARRRRTAADER
jgi:hypothetical protein